MLALPHEQVHQKPVCECSTVNGSRPPFKRLFGTVQTLPSISPPRCAENFSGSWALEAHCPLGLSGLIFCRMEVEFLFRAWPVTY